MAQVKKIVAIELVEIRSGDNERTSIASMVLLCKEKNALAIKEKHTSIDLRSAYEWLKDKNLTNIPVILTINSDRILHKVIPEGTQISDVLTATIHNFSTDNYIVETMQLPGGSHFVSISRKDFIDAMLTKMPEIADNTINISIGPSSIFSTYKNVAATHSNSNTIAFENYHFEITENNIQKHNITSYTDKILNDNKRIQVAGDEIPVRYYIAFSSAVSFYLMPFKLNTDYPAIKKKKENYLFNTISKPAFMIVLAVLFAGLIVSTICYSSYYKEYEISQNEISTLREKLTLNNISSQKESERTEFMKINGILQYGDITFYSDQITKCIPKDVYLTKLQIYPLESKFSTESDQFNSNKIFIEGNSYSSIEVNEWIKALSSYGWVKGINLINFKQEVPNELGSFTIEITK